MATVIPFRRGLALLIAALLAGCSDNPTGVGLDFVDAQAGEPFVLTLDADSFVVRAKADVTGGSIGLDANFNTVRLGAARALSGRVDDPSLGAIEARADLDFLTLQVPGDEFKNGTVSSVRLKLDVDYVYGDTLTDVVVALHEIAQDWEAVGRRADTTLSVDAEIARFTLEPKKTLQSVDLPTTWVLANDALLRSDNLADDFHGFQLRAVEGNAVLGFSSSGTLLEVAVPGDTLTLTVERLISELERSAVPEPGTEAMLQDGFGSLDLQFDFDRPELTDNSIHKAIFRLQIPEMPLETPAGFYRPPVQTINLVAITGESEVRTILDSVDPTGGGSIAFESDDINVAMQNTVRGRGDLVRFEIEVPTADASFGTLFFGSTAGIDGPRVILTVTEVQ